MTAESAEIRQPSAGAGEQGGTSAALGHDLGVADVFPCRTHERQG